MAKHNTVFDQMDVVTYEEVVKLQCNQSSSVIDCNNSLTNYVTRHY